MRAKLKDDVKIKNMRNNTSICGNHPTQCNIIWRRQISNNSTNMNNVILVL